MNKLFTLLFTFLSLACINAKAQVQPFEEAYIIQDTDTIHGFIKSGTDLELSKSINFKTELNSANATEYKPADIKGFYFKKSGFTYASVQAEVITGALTQQASRFAKLLLSGYTELYKLQIPEEEQAIVLQTQNTFVYVLKKDTAYYTLGNYETQSGDIVRTNKRYIGVLRAAFTDCENYQDNLDELNFNDKSIIAEVVKYNACKNPAMKGAVQNYKVKPVIKHGPEFGFATSYASKNPNNLNSHGYSVGYFLDIIQPDKSRKHSMKVGVGYMYYLYEYNVPNGEKASGAIHYLRVPISGQYNFKDAVSSTLIPFLNVGIAPRITSDPDNSEIVSLFHIGAGMYYKRMKYAIQIDNDGFKFAAPKIFNFTFGVRLDK